jgi:membrane protease YdiL (CAAX protease family)
VLHSAPEQSSYPLVENERSEPPAPFQRRAILPVERLGALLEVLLCSGVPTQILAFAAVTQFGLAARGAGNALSPAFLIGMSAVDMVLVLGLVVLFLRAHDESVRDFVVGGRRVAKEALVGLVMIPGSFALLLVVFALILTIKPSLHNVPVSPFEPMLQTPQDAAVLAVLVMFAGGVREEIQRAFIIRRFDRYLGGAVPGIVLFSVVFGAGHVYQGYAAAIATGTLGAIWGVLYWRRGSIIAPMISHAGFNLAQLVKYVTLAAH